MQIHLSHPSDTEALLRVTADAQTLDPIKQHVLRDLSKSVKVAGFREGKVPLDIVEKNVDPTRLQTEFLEHAVNHAYSQAVQKEKLRVIGQPEINIKKFVPYSTLEFEATMPIIGKIEVGNYKKLKAKRGDVNITADDINNVIENLQTRASEKEDVDRPAKEGDQVWIDFAGVDDKGQPINGADGKDYPLLLGSNTFIPGFETNLVGLKAKDTKTFNLTFPKDYSVSTLANRKVTFSVEVTKVQKVVKPKADDAFAAKVGPFKTVKDLKADIKKELTAERHRQNEAEYESALVAEIAEKSKVPLPAVLVDEQVERSFNELKQNLTYRGQTIKEFLEGEKQ